MKLLDKLVLKDLLPMFFIGVAMFCTLYFCADPVLVATRFLAMGVPWRIVALIVVLTLPEMISLTLPMGMLIATLIGFGRLSGDSEAVALFAGGIPFARIAASAVLLGLAASLLGYLVNDRVASRAEKLRADLILHWAKSSSSYDYSYPPSGPLQFTVHAEKGFDASTKMLRQVTLTLYAPAGSPKAIIYAPSATWIPDTTNFSFDSPQINSLGPGGYYMGIAEAKVFDLKTSAKYLEMQQQKPETMDFAQLRHKIEVEKASGRAKPEDIRNDETNLWSKIATPFASLVFALVGAPLGLRPQRTAKYTGWVLSILIIFGYYIILTVMSSVARGGGCSPALAAFMPNIVGVLVGSYLIWKQSA